MKKFMKRIKEREKRIPKIAFHLKRKLDLIQVDVSFLFNREEKITKEELGSIFFSDRNVYCQDDRVFFEGCKIKKIKKV